jgi:hypothetical protein
MATRPPTSEPIFTQCLEQACVLSRDLMVQLVQQAVALMQAKQATITDMQARIHWDDDTRDLLRQRENLAANLVKNLKLALDAAIQFNAAPVEKNEATPKAQVKFEELELVDDAKVQNLIETGRMQQTAEAACERELAELDTLICSARGLTIVRAESNPLRPRNFCTAITQSIADIAAPPAQSALWMQQLAAVLGPELRKLYAKLIEQLVRQRVQAVGYSVNFSIAGAPCDDGGTDEAAYTGQSQGQASGGRAARVALPKRDRTASAAKLSVGQLRQVLGGAHFRATGMQDQVTAEDLMHEVDELKALVQSLGGTAPTGMARTPRIPSSDAAQETSQESILRTSRAGAISVLESQEQTLEEPTPDPAEQAAVAQDIVRLMVDELCGDERLLECVRDWVNSLEPPLLALAKVQADFLNDDAHPARRILDEVTSRSLGFGSDQAEGFAAFFDPVVLATTALVPYAIHDAQPFVQAWDAIEQAWSQQKSAAQIQREQAQQAMADAERRKLLADKIALELTRRDDARFAPIFVKQFLASVWAQVLAQARLDGADQKAQHYLDVVAQLLWSAVPEQTANDKQGLVRMIGGMLTTLRAGLDSIGVSHQQEEAFFNQLMDLHQAALKANTNKLREVAVVTAPVVSAPVPIQEDLAIPQQDAAAWLAPQAMLDAGYIESVFDDMDDLEPLSEAEGEEMAESLPDQVTAAVVDTGAAAVDNKNVLTQPPELGTWIEFLSHDQWVRAQLTWASPHGTLYMFTGAAGNPHSMTRRALDKMLSRQAIRLAQQSNSMVKGALNALAQAALRQQAG